MVEWLYKLVRKKPPECSDGTQLHRCLTMWDLTFLGVGSMMGSGIYVMAGVAAKEQAGPAIVLSFIFAALTIILVMACFTEFAATTHRTGATYLYVYLSLGELPAFLVGFTGLILPVLGGAVNARAWSGYLDSVFNNQIANFTETHILSMSIGAPFATYPDFLAAGISLVMMTIVAFGASCSSRLNLFFAFSNCGVLVFVSIVGFVYADIENWTSEEHGGFMPFGIQGVLQGSAVCFWAFSGFEVISCSIEEARNPKRDIPLSMGLAMGMVTLLYVCTAASMTLVTPYYTIDTHAPLPSAFIAQGITWAKYIAAVGPLLGLTTTLMSSYYGFVRNCYAIAEDGLIPPIFSRVNSYTKIPVTPVLINGFVGSLIAMFLDLSDIISFAVLLTLLSYALVCIGVIILRYRPKSTDAFIPGDFSVKFDKENGVKLHMFSSQENRAAKETEGDVISLDGAQPPYSFVEEAGFSLDGKDKLSELELCNISNTSSQQSLENSNPRDRNGLDFLSDDEEDIDLYLRETFPSAPPAGTLKPRCLWLEQCCDFGPGRWPCLAVFLLCVVSLFTAVVLIYAQDELQTGTWWTILLLCVLILAAALLVASLYAFRQTTENLRFRMACVPLLPVVAVTVLLFLMVFNAEARHWIGISVMLVIELVVYFAYSIQRSKLNQLAQYETMDDATEPFLPEID